jgi:hypothetical protein
MMAQLGLPLVVMLLSVKPELFRSLLGVVIFGSRWTIHTHQLPSMLGLQKQAVSGLDHNSIIERGG